MPLSRLKPVEAPWGDYGHILTHGMSMHAGRKDGRILLERTGPSISPITFPGAGDIVVTDAFRSALEKSGLTGFTFLDVIKHHIVDLDWENWDVTDDEPPQLPEEGEPENYILSGEHSLEASKALGQLWELVLHAGMEVDRNGTEVHLLGETWNGSDFVYARSTRIACVSPKAQAWLERNFADFLVFKPLN